MTAVQFIKQVDRILVVDFETSGLNSQYDYIMQIGAVVMDSGDVLDTFSERITLKGTKAKISLEALTVQGGNPEDAVKDYLELIMSGSEKGEVFAKLAGWLKKNSAADLPVVGQNAIYFDAGFWSQLYFQCRAIHKGEQILGPLWIDTMDLARRLFPGQKVNLDAICSYLDLPSRPGGHDALQDCILTGLAFFKMQELLGVDQ